jgi:hypothetical protein
MQFPITRRQANRSRTAKRLAKKRKRSANTRNKNKHASVGDGRVGRVGESVT